MYQCPSGLDVVFVSVRVRTSVYALYYMYGC